MGYDKYEVIDQDRDVESLSRSFFASVYQYMFLALVVSGAVAWYAHSADWYLPLMFTESGLSGLGYVVMFAPVGLVLLIQFRIEKMSFGVAMLLFMLYAVLIGISLAFIFLVYTSSSIALTFLVTAGAFGSMALLGYFTKTDLSKMGSLMYMLFIGMFIAGIANWIIGSETLDYVISFLGLFVFTGLTAWKMQEMKTTAADTSLTAEQRSKSALIGGLVLYILFINLFMSILRFVGDR